MPTVDAVNAIGAGDVCTGVFAHHLGKGDEPVDAFAWGLAAACARVTRQLPGFEAAKVRESRRFGLASPHPSPSPSPGPNPSPNPDQVRELRQQVVVEELEY